jgi:hypothetical protein
MTNAVTTEAISTVRADQITKRLTALHSARAEKEATSRTASWFAPSRATVATTVAIDIATATMP